LSYDAEPVGLEAARALTEMALARGFRYTQSSDPKRIERLLNAHEIALRRRFRQPGCEDEVTRWLRFSNRDARTRGDGLDARCLGKQPFALFAQYRLPKLRSRREEPPATATMGCLAGPFGSCKEWSRAGQFLMRFLLECTRLGLVIQPLASLVNDADAAKRSWHDWRVPGIWLEFRIGSSCEPAKSYRRAVDALLLEEDEIRSASPPTSRATLDRRS